MTAENGNGELRQLAAVKRAFKSELADVEKDLREKFERELSAKKLKLREKYLEKVVDAVFGESPDVKVPEPREIEESVESPKCPECGTPVASGDKFCANCASPLKDEEEMSSEPGLAVAGRVLKSKRR